MSKLVLASASPRRRQLLAQIGVTPDHVAPADIDETPRFGEAPRAYAIRMGHEKAIAVHNDGQFTLAGDTVVSVGRRILPKAETDEDVADCLRLVSGRAHHVMTSVCLIGPTGQVVQRLNDTRVIVKRLSTAEIKAYVETQDGLGKAGGYAIQGPFGAKIHQIPCSYTGVMGLPVHETADVLNGLCYRL